MKTDGAPGLLKGLKTARKNKGWTKAELGRRADLHQNYVGQLERKERNCSIEVLSALAVTLGVTPNDLLEFEQNTEAA